MNINVWFKLENPKDNWTRVSLEEVEYVDDLKKKIKIKMAPKLDTFASSSLTLKATYNNDNPNEAIELHEKDERKKTKYDRLADESLKALYLETIREERKKNELNLDIIKVALISLVNISIDVLNKGHNDDESIKTFMLILNAIVGGIQLLVIILKIVRIVVVIILFSILLKVDISPNIAIY
ncbi:unnamed protein product [Rhizophagus irregularis]|nr:unnamed protein product [Rhizophagus irregularis]